MTRGKERGMRDRLARLVEQMTLAGKRRWDDTAAEPFSATIAVLRADHPMPADTDTDALAAISEIFALEAVELDLLTVAASVELDPNFGLAFALLQGNPNAARPTVALALELCDVPIMSAAGRARLSPSAPLRRYGLLDVDGSEPAPRRPLRVADRVVAHLLGDDSYDPAVAAMRLDLGAVGELADLPVARVLSAAIERGEPLAWVHARPGTIGIALAAAAFGALDIAALVVDLRRCPADVALDDALRGAGREAALQRRGLVLAGAELLAEEGAAWLTRRLLDVAVPVIAVADAPWRAAWLDFLPVSVTAPASSAELRDLLWRASVRDAPVDDPVWPDVVNLRLTPEQIAQAGRFVTRTADGAPVSVAALLSAARRVGSTRGTGARAAKPSASLDDLVLPDATLESIRQLISWARRRDSVLAANPRLVAGGKGRGVSALFAGASGTGKTLAAHVVADTLNLDLYQVELPTVIDKYIGETEKNLQRVFQEAENLNAVLFFDEADSLFGARSEVRDSRDRYANIEVAYLLQRMEQFDGIAILATNLRGNLDVAFSRRLQFIVHFPDPDEPTRRHLWLRHLQGFEPLDADDPVDVDQLARTVELAGGDIRNIVMAAAYAAADDGRPIGMRHLTTAVERELRKLGRRVPPPGH